MMSETCLADNAKRCSASMHRLNRGKSLEILNCNYTIIHQLFNCNMYMKVT